MFSTESPAARRSGESTTDSRVDDQWQLIAEALTDDAGRVGCPQTGVHRLRFDTGEYFRRTQTETFYPEVIVTFAVTDPDAHHHVPLLLSPFAFSAYRAN